MPKIFHNARFSKFHHRSIKHYLLFQKVYESHPVYDLWPVLQAKNQFKLEFSCVFKRDLDLWPLT